MKKKDRKKSAKTGNARARKKAIFSLLVFCTIGFMLVLFSQIFYPYAESVLDVWALFLIFYVSVAVLWVAFFSAFWGLDRKTFKASLLITFLIAAFDMFYQPYAVAMDGTVSTGGNVGKSSIDYFFGYYLNSIGICGVLLFVFVYFIIPLIMLAIILWILKPMKFIKAMRQGAA